MFKPHLQSDCPGPRSIKTGMDFWFALPPSMQQYRMLIQSLCSHAYYITFNIQNWCDLRAKGVRTTRWEENTTARTFLTASTRLQAVAGRAPGSIRRINTDAPIIILRRVTHCDLSRWTSWNHFQRFFNGNQYVALMMDRYFRLSRVISRSKTTS